MFDDTEEEHASQQDYYFYVATHTHTMFDQILQ